MVERHKIIDVPFHSQQPLNFPTGLTILCFFAIIDQTIFGNVQIPATKMDRNQKDIDQLVKSVVEAVQPLKIILFGSAARDNTTPDSDVDLLVVMPEGIHRRETARYLYKHLGETGIPVDILEQHWTDLSNRSARGKRSICRLSKSGKEVLAIGCCTPTVI
jgi:predicted nucleotidyltransferase